MTDSRDSITRLEASRRASELLLAADTDLHSEGPADLYLINTRIRLAEVYLHYSEKRLT